MSITADDVRRVVATYYASVRAGDVDATVALFAPTGEMHDPVGVPPATDDAARRQRYTGIAAFEKFSITESRVLVCGTEAAASWTIRATARNGRDLTFDGISTFAVDDAGKIARMCAYWETASVAAAMQP